ncbi:ABC transporter substrate-binding protein [Acrocarpospora macrocephala]|uniref:ABC transporter substrate-binding protein n=1 Tax=Acrocarpospora macrocephala TaxID=150177 RepID=A0A5M3WN22_9ACTN|nr:extracellular solute-binding protein [Acrocarpospora macrocephala]GES10046.1 ABC transporter substrate-binding protein [Acrocarpospora macrocephala]
MRRRLLPALSALTAGSLLLAGCGPGSGPAATQVTAPTDVAKCDPAKSTLTISHQPPAAEAVAVAKQRMAARYPNLKINVNALQTKTYDEFTRAVVADIAVGKRPDLIISGLGQIRFWMEQYKPAPIDAAALPATYRKQFLSAGTLDGKVYVAPAQVSVPMMAVNQTLLRKAGAGDAAGIRTYDDLIAAARKVTAMTRRPSVTVATYNIPDWLSQGFVQGAGGTFVTGDGRPAFGDKLGGDAISLWSRLKREDLELGIVMDADSQAAFAGGTAAFLMTSSASIAGLQKSIGDSFEWMPVDLPTVNGQRGPMPAGGNGWLVLSDDPCRAAFANTMIGDLLSTDGVMAASGTSYSYIPVDSAAAERLLASDAATPQTKYAWGYDRELTPWGGWRRGEVTGQIVDAFRTMAQRLQSGADAGPTIQTAVRAIDSLVSG